MGGQSVIITSKRVGVPDRVIHLGKYLLIRALVLAALLLVTSFILLPTIRQAIQIRPDETGDWTQPLLDWANRNQMFVIPALYWVLLVPGLLRAALGAVRMMANRGVPTAVSTDIQDIESKGDLPRFLERRELVRRQVGGLKRLLLMPLIPGIDDLSRTYWTLLDGLRVKFYLFLLLLVALPLILLRSGLAQKIDEGSQGAVEITPWLEKCIAPWPLAGLILAGVLIAIVAIRAAGRHHKLIEVSNDRVHNASSGDPTSYFYSVLDLLEDATQSDYRNKAYLVNEPQIGRTSAGETNRYEASFCVESYPRNIEVPVRRPAIVLIAGAIAIEAVGLGYLLMSPILLPAFIFNAFAALVFAFVARGLAKLFWQAATWLAFTYRFESEVFLAHLKGTYGSALVMSDPNAAMSGRRSMLDSETRAEVWSARLITETVVTPRNVSPRYLVDAVASPEFELKRDALVRHMKSAKLLGGHDAPPRSLPSSHAE